MMKNCKKYLPLIIGIFILAPVFILPSIQTTINSNEHDHDDHADNLQLSYVPCECGNPGCTGNIATCPWSLGVPRPAPILSQPPSPDDDGIITLTWTSSYGAISYKVYRSDAEFGSYTLIATTASLSYTDTTTYGPWWYYIRAHNNNGDSAASNRVAVVVLSSPPTTWYESNEEYNLGDFPSNEWNPYGGGSVDRIDVVWASNYNVDMWGKAIRFYSPGYGYGTGVERVETFTIATGESLYLKFNAQINKIAANGEGKIHLVGNSGLTFLEMTFDTYWERLDIEFADGHIGIFHDLILNQVYHFDIMFIKDPDTNNLKYLIFIDQKLEFLYEVNTALYPLASYIELLMNEAGPGEFFIDNFFLGDVNNSISPKETVESAFPMYYLYIPQWLPGTDHVNAMNIKYFYEHIYDQTLSFSFRIGVELGIGFDVAVPIGDVIPLQGGPDQYYYEVATTGEDVIVFYWIIGDIRNVTFYLPGIDPESGTSEIKGMYEYTFLEEHITSDSITAFEQHFGALPQEYYDCSRSGNAQIFDFRMIQAKCDGAQLKFYDIDHVVLDYSWTFDWGISLNVPIYKELEFDFGVSFVTECTNIYEARISLGIDWDSSVGFYDKIQYDLYAPPEGSYSTSLDLAPYSVQQVPYTVPTNPTGLTATPGQNRVDLSWTANPESDIDHYNIYRNNVKVGESTTTSYADTGLADSTTYTYEVSAVNFYGEEGPRSNSVQATTNPPPPVTPATPGIYLIMIVSFGIVGLLINRKTKKRKIDR